MERATERFAGSGAGRRRSSPGPSAAAARSGCLRPNRQVYWSFRSGPSRQHCLSPEGNRLILMPGDAAPDRHPVRPGHRPSATLPLCRLRHDGGRCRLASALPIDARARSAPGPPVRPHALSGRGRRARAPSAGRCRDQPRKHARPHPEARRGVARRRRARTDNRRPGDHPDAGFNLHPQLRGGPAPSRSPARQCRGIQWSPAGFRRGRQRPTPRSRR